MEKLCEVCGKERVRFSWETECYACQMESHRKTVQEGIATGEENETFCEDEIFCPYCGHVYSTEDEYELLTEDTHERECPECEKTFQIDTYVSYSFSTARTQEEE